MANSKRPPLTDVELTEFLRVRLEKFNRENGHEGRDSNLRMAGQFGILQSMFIRLINGEETPAKMLSGIRESMSGRGLDKKE